MVNTFLLVLFCIHESIFLSGCSASTNRVYFVSVTDPSADSNLAPFLFKLTFFKNTEKLGDVYVSTTPYGPIQQQQMSRGSMQIFHNTDRITLPDDSLSVKVTKFSQDATEPVILLIPSQVYSGEGPTSFISHAAKFDIRRVDDCVNKNDTSGVCTLLSPTRKDTIKGGLIVKANEENVELKRLTFLEDVLTAKFDTKASYSSDDTPVPVISFPVKKEMNFIVVVNDDSPETFEILATDQPQTHSFTKEGQNSYTITLTYIPTPKVIEPSMIFTYFTLVGYLENKDDEAFIGLVSICASTTLSKSNCEGGLTLWNLNFIGQYFRLNDLIIGFPMNDPIIDLRVNFIPTVGGNSIVESASLKLDLNSLIANPVSSVCTASTSKRCIGLVASDILEESDGERHFRLVLNIPISSTLTFTAFCILQFRGECVSYFESSNEPINEFSSLKSYELALFTTKAVSNAEPQTFVEAISLFSGEYKFSTGLNQVITGLDGDVTYTIFELGPSSDELAVMRQWDYTEY